MSDFWAKTKSGLAEAKDASKRAALRTKAKADLELLRRRQHKLKQDFGVEVFAFWDDSGKRDAVYDSYKIRIDELAKAITAKSDEIARLKKNAPPADVGHQSRQRPPQQQQQQQQSQEVQEPTMSEI